MINPIVTENTKNQIYLLICINDQRLTLTVISIILVYDYSQTTRATVTESQTTWIISQTVGRRSGEEIPDSKGLSPQEFQTSMEK